MRQKDIANSAKRVLKDIAQAPCFWLFIIPCVRPELHDRQTAYVVSQHTGKVRSSLNHPEEELRGYELEISKVLYAHQVVTSGIYLCFIFFFHLWTVPYESIKMLAELKEKGRDWVYLVFCIWKLKPFFSWARSI